jgi:hypothetical protein
MKRNQLFIGLLALSCGGRPASYDERFEAGPIVGLQTAVAVMDPALDRVIMLESPSHLELRASYLPVGRGVVNAVASPKKDRLFVLSQGVQPRRHKSDELPSLAVIDTLPKPKVSHTYELSDPFAGLSLDPEDRWALVHAGEGLVENPNELILVDLERPNAEPVVKSIRSFGGRPSKFTFTSELAIPDAEPRRLLIVQTEQDLTLIDLADLDAPEITVLTPETESTRFSRPDKVVFHDADDDSDPVLAVSFSNNSSILLIGLVAGNDQHAFLPQINSIIDVGGQPSAIDFVETDGGLRLAAIVPLARHAALVDPKTTTVDLVPMPAQFTGLTRVTDAIDDTSSFADTALLWRESEGRVGIWQLDAAIGAPYNSIETFDISVPVGRVLDVPGADQGACADPEHCFAQYKIVASSGAGDFYLLDLNRRQASLMVTNGKDLSLSLSPDGERLWAFESDGVGFSQVRFSDLHANSLEAEAPIRGVFDVGRPSMGSESGDSARSAIVLYAGEGLAATVFDGTQPDEAVTRFYGGIAYGGIAK